jgi:hypothetical protein
MAKARPSRKAQRKSGGSRASKTTRKVAKGRAPKTARATASAAAKVARPKNGRPSARPKAVAHPGGADAARKARPQASKSVTPEVIIPETPPPLPAPIASFTF